MHNLLLAIVILFALTLTGCKAVIETSVSLNDLLHGKSKTINGNLNIEVAACNDFNDSRKPSNSLTKAQETIPTIFADAEYTECYSKEFKSYALFNIPIVINKDKNGIITSDKYINVISNNHTLMTIGIPKAINQNLERVKNNSYGTMSFDVKVNVVVINDTGKAFPFNVIASYIDKQPHIYNELTSNPNDSFEITLSDVSISHALENELALVLMHVSSN